MYETENSAQRSVRRIIEVLKFQKRTREKNALELSEVGATIQFWKSAVQQLKVD